jgi:hypothetical protein
VPGVHPYPQREPDEFLSAAPNADDLLRNRGEARPASFHFGLFVQVMS